MSMDAAPFRISGDAGKKGVADFVGFTRLGYLLGDRMGMVLEKVFCEGR